MRLCGRRFDYLQRVIFMENFWNFQNYSKYKNHLDISLKQTCSKEIQMISKERSS